MAISIRVCGRMQVRMQVRPVYPLLVREPSPSVGYDTVCLGMVVDAQNQVRACRLSILRVCRYAFAYAVMYTHPNARCLSRLRTGSTTLASPSSRTRTS